MRRASKIFTELNVGFSTLQDYAHKIGEEISHPNEKVSSEVEEKLRQVHFGEIPLSNSLSLQNENVEGEPNDGDLVISTLPEFFHSVNPFEELTKDIVLREDVFVDKIPELQVFGSQRVNSIFSNTQAFQLCSGSKDRHLTFIARKFFADPKNLTNAYEAHVYAMRLFDKYGGKALSYLLGLPQLPIKVFRANKIFEVLDQKKKTQKNPMIRLLHHNIDGDKEKLQITFYRERAYPNSHLYKNVLVVRNKSTKKPIMKISRDGKVVPEPNSQEIIPILRLFVSVADDPRSKIEYYGIETGECSICGRPLTDPKSLESGIGPICAQGF